MCRDFILSLIKKLMMCLVFNIQLSSNKNLNIKKKSAILNKVKNGITLIGLLMTISRNL